MAERVGFEPTDGVNHHTISSRAPSTNSAISPLACELFALAYYTRLFASNQVVFFMHV